MKRATLHCLLSQVYVYMDSSKSAKAFSKPNKQQKPVTN